MSHYKHNLLRATETEKEYQERVSYAKDGPSRTIKQYRCPGGCARLVDWGSLAYCKAFRSMRIDARRSLVHKRFCYVIGLKGTIVSQIAGRGTVLYVKVLTIPWYAKNHKIKLQAQPPQSNRDRKGVPREGKLCQRWALKNY